MGEIVKKMVHKRNIAKLVAKRQFKDQVRDRRKAGIEGQYCRLIVEVVC